MQAVSGSSALRLNTTRRRLTNNLLGLQPLTSDGGTFNRIKKWRTVRYWSDSRWDGNGSASVAPSLKEQMDGPRFHRPFSYFAQITHTEKNECMQTQNKTVLVSTHTHTHTPMLSRCCNQEGCCTPRIETCLLKSSNVSFFKNNSAIKLTVKNNSCRTKRRALIQLITKTSRITG